MTAPILLVFLSGFLFGVAATGFYVLAADWWKQDREEGRPPTLTPFYVGATAYDDEEGVGGVDVCRNGCGMAKGKHSQWCPVAPWNWCPAEPKTQPLLAPPLEGTFPDAYSKEIIADLKELAKERKASKPIS